MFQRLFFHCRDAFFELNSAHRYKKLTRFKKADAFLKKAALFKNPYTVCRKAHRNPSDGLYGETPLQTIEALLDRFGFLEGESFVDLGSGRGRVCFFVSERFQKKALGIESVEPFVQTAQHIVNTLNFSSVQFEVGSYHNRSLGKALYYWYSTAIPREVIRKVAQNFDREARVITVSEPLAIIDPNRWVTLDRCPALFPWGETTAFLNGRRS